MQQQERDDSNLYIANLPLQTSEKDLEVMFANFGGVVSTRILRAPNGISRGVGFVRMESKHVCETVINSFNNKLLPGQYDCAVSLFQKNNVPNFVYKLQSFRCSNCSLYLLNESSYCKCGNKIDSRASCFANCMKQFATSPV